LLGVARVSAVNSITATVSVECGTLQLNSATPFTATTANSPFLNIRDNATLQLNGISLTVGSPSGNGGISAGALASIQNASTTPATLTVVQSSAAPQIFAGTMSDGAGGGALSFVKSGRHPEIPQYAAYLYRQHHRFRGHAAAGQRARGYYQQHHRGHESVAGRE
jgi:hypothetical protein